MLILESSSELWPSNFTLNGAKFQFSFQLLRFALFPEQPVPPQLEAMLACEGRER